MMKIGVASRAVPQLAVALAALTYWIAASGFAYEPKTLEIGAAAPDFNLLGTDDQRHSLADFADSDILVVIFTTNHCPDAIASYSRMRQMVDDYHDRNVGFVAINGNNPEAVMLDELRWTRYDDTFESMKIVAKDEHFNLLYLYDGKTQAVTKAYGAVATPHVFIFDRQRKLQYTGRLDSGRRNPGRAATSESRDAIDALLAGKPVSTPKTLVFGCSTKWIEDRPLVAQSDDGLERAASNAGPNRRRRDQAPRRQRFFRLAAREHLVDDVRSVRGRIPRSREDVPPLSESSLRVDDHQRRHTQRAGASREFLAGSTRGLGTPHRTPYQVIRPQNE